MEKELYLSLLNWFRKKFEKESSLNESFCNDSESKAEVKSIIKGYKYPSFLLETLNFKYYVILKRIDVDGCSGGNCYSDDAQYYYSGEEDVYINDEKFMKIFGFNLKELKVHVISCTDSGYYGNYTNYSYHIVFIYDILIKISRQHKIEEILKNIQYKIILVIGLPASGKTTWSKKYAHENNFILIDDPKSFENDILPYLKQDKNLIITDPHLCNKKVLDKAIEKILSIKDCIIEKVFFENDKDKALKNALTRKDKKVESFIKELSKIYDPERIDLKIYG